MNKTSTEAASLNICTSWIPTQQSALFQLANVWFLIGYCSRNSQRGFVFLHASLVIGYIFYSWWAWNIICEPTIFACSLSFVLLNFGQTLYTSHLLQPVRFAKYLENVYQKLFQPLKVERAAFGKLTSSQYTHFVTLQKGDYYAIEFLSKSDRLALNLSGRFQIMQESRSLHIVNECEFLDSPEFHCCNVAQKQKKRFEVSIVALDECHVLVWQREDIEYLMITDAYLRNLMEHLIATDIFKKLKIIQEHETYFASSNSKDLRLRFCKNRPESNAPHFDYLQIEYKQQIENKNHLQVENVLKKKKKAKRKNSVSVFDGNFETNLLHNGNSNLRRNFLSVSTSSMFSSESDASG